MMLSRIVFTSSVGRFAAMSLFLNDIIAVIISLRSAGDSVTYTLFFFLNIAAPQQYTNSERTTSSARLRMEFMAHNQPIWSDVFISSVTFSAAAYCAVSNASIFSTYSPSSARY